MKKSKKIFYSILILAIILTNGCNKKSIQMTNQHRQSWVGSNVPGHITAKYKKFTGIEHGEISVRDGQKISIVYEVSVKNGSLSIIVKNTDILWHVELDSNTQNNISLPINKSGNYQIIISGKNTSGSFDVSWKVKS